MKNYQVTIGYRAVINIDVNAENESDAKEKAVDIFTKKKDKIFGMKGIILQDDNYRADGCLDMDATWNMYDKF